MDSARDKALKEKALLESRLKAIDQFLAMYEEFARTKEGRGEAENSEVEGGLNTVTPTINEDTARERRALKPKELGNVVRDILLDAGEPMTRGPLAAALQDLGYGLPAKNKGKYVGTVLWRLGDMFVNIEGRGYWPIDVPNEEEGYFPADDQSGGTDVEPIENFKPVGQSLDDLT